MPGVVFRLAILALALLALWGVVGWVRRRIDTERSLALAASSPSAAVTQHLAEPVTPVRILAFSSETCRPCHTLQRPALEQISAWRGEDVEITWIDAPSSPELTQLYHVLTVPTTVVLDKEQHVHAVNYGFANTKRLLEQINGVLGKNAGGPG
ncbi:MAG: thioredoxin family protein [Ktedonobacterales bacterium]